jgi:hypothetical protein
MTRAWFLVSDRVAKVRNSEYLYKSDLEEKGKALF